MSHCGSWGTYQLVPTMGLILSKIRALGSGGRTLRASKAQLAEYILSRREDDGEIRTRLGRL